MRPISISTYSSLYDSPTRVDTSLDELCSSLLEVVEVDKKNDAALWSPILYKGGARKSTEAYSITALVYDLDNPDEDYSPLLEKLKDAGLFFVWHPTFTAGCFRLVLPLSEDVTPKQYEVLRVAVEKNFDIKHDPACSDLARVFYVPSCPTGSLSSRQAPLKNEGTLLDPFKYIDTPRRPQVTERVIDLLPLKEDISKLDNPARREQAIQLVDGTLHIPPSEREAMLHPLMGTISHLRNAPSTEDMAALLRRVLQTRDGADSMLEGWISKALYSYSRGLEHKQSMDESAAQVESFFHSDEWMERLKFKKDKTGAIKGLKPLEYNIITVLDNDPEFKGYVRWNLLKSKIEVVGGFLKSQPVDSLDVSLAAWLQQSSYDCDAPTGMIGACIMHTALRNEYDPVKEYLNTIPEWDGTKRLANVLLDYGQAEGAPDWIQLVTSKFFVSAIARAMQPGCQVDNTLVLHGAQGGGKTSFVRAMGAGFHVEMSLDLQNKDAIMASSSNWLVELGELASLRRSDVESVRNFLTRKEDQIRLPYGRTIKSMPRRCVFIGTTNSRQPLSDQEGNRRYWVVSVGSVNTEGILKVRDQLWAEALFLYRSGYEWWLNQEESIRAKEEVAPYESEDVTSVEILQWLAGLSEKDWPKFISSIDVAKKVLNRMAGGVTPHDMSNINRALGKMGWMRTRRKFDGNYVRGYEVPPRSEIFNDEN